MNPACPQCGAAIAPGRLEACPVCLLQAPEAKIVLGGAIELEAEIGRGGMGQVWRARHVRLGRTVAVKLLPAALAGRPEFRARFEREARALAMLNHPSIVAIHDFGEEDGQGYLVMEHVAGGPLAVAAPLPVARALDIAIQVGDALACAHAAGIVHRDIKPANILLDGAGRVKVSDFGIARLVGPDAKGWTVTSPDVAVGTPHYLAPEALAGAAPDPRMDLYSLGVVLYQMATGRLPVGHFEPAPGPVDRIVRRALAPDPARRYGSAEEMRRDLEAARRAVAAPGAVADELPVDEKVWVRVVALLQSVSTAVALWALLESVRPKIIAPDEVRPLIMIGVERLGDGRIVSRARFETWWTLAALATFAVAITGYGLLRRHWRREGLERAEPDRPVAASRWVLFWGIVAVAVYAIRLLQERSAALDPYKPIVGGLIEVAALYCFWVALLQAWRTGRPFRREPKIWAGFGLALVPPAVDLVRWLVAWTP